MPADDVLDHLRREDAAPAEARRVRAVFARCFRAVVRHLPPDAYGFSDDRQWTEPTMTAAFELWWSDILEDGRVRDWLASSTSMGSLVGQASAAARNWAVDH